MFSVRYLSIPLLQCPLIVNQRFYFHVGRMEIIYGIAGIVCRQGNVISKGGARQVLLGR